MGRRKHRKTYPWQETEEQEWCRAEELRHIEMIGRGVAVIYLSWPNSPAIERQVGLLRMFLLHFRLKYDWDDDKSRIRLMFREIMHLMTVDREYRRSPMCRHPAVFDVEGITYLEKRSTLQFLRDDFPDITEDMMYSEEAIKVDDYLAEYLPTRNVRKIYAENVDSENYGHYERSWPKHYPASHTWFAREKADEVEVDLDFTQLWKE